MCSRDEEYWKNIKKRAKELKSDGCSGVADFYVDCCYEHDVHYKTRKRLDGSAITRAEADARFRRCIQEKSKFGKSSPMSWWRWAGLRLFGGKAWKDNLEKHPS